MKCEYCGGSLSLEDEYCPHCSRENIHAKQHIEDMKYYHGEFEDTKAYVRNKAGVYSAISVRAVIIAVLLLLTIGLFVMSGMSWDIYKNYKRAQADSRYLEYSAEMDRMIKNGDYLELDRYVSAKMIRRYDGAYDSYMPYIQACDYYKDVYDCIHRFISCNSVEDMGSSCDLFGSSIEFFYREYENMEKKTKDYDLDSDGYQKMLHSMEKEIHLMLKVYCGFTDSELEELGSISKARKDVLFEEKLKQKLEGVIAE